MFNNVEHIVFSQSVGYTDEGESQLPSWCVSKLLREDHTEEPSAAVPEPVAPSAGVGPQVPSAHLNKSDQRRFLIAPMDTRGLCFEVLGICVFQQTER